LNLTDEHYDETTQWRHHNASGDVAPLFLAQKGLQHFMRTELLSTTQSILPPPSAAGAGAGQGGARVAGLSGRAPSGMPSAVDSSIETGRIEGGIEATETLTLGKEGLKEAPATPLLPPVRPTRPSRSSSRSGNVVPSTLFPRNPRNMNRFPISDTSDSAYREWLVKYSLPPYLDQHCSFAFTVDNDEVTFQGKSVNPATHSDLLVGGNATLRTPFCVLFSDKECKPYSTSQTNKAVKLSHKIDLIAAIIAHVSIHDMLGLDSLAPVPQVQASFKETSKLCIRIKIME